MEYVATAFPALPWIMELLEKFVLLRLEDIWIKPAAYWTEKA